MNERGRGRIFPRSYEVGRYLSVILGSLLLAYTLLSAATAQENGRNVSRSSELAAPAAASHAEQDLIVAVEDATARLAGRLRQVASFGREVADAPAVFWRWLTREGNDPWAPVRALAVALVILLLGGLAQRAAARAMTTRRWTRFSTDRVSAAVFVVRWLAFVAAAGLAHALIPEVSRPSRLTSLALTVIVAGTWIGSQVVAHAIAPFGPGSMSPATLRTGPLQAALAIGFSVLSGLALLREAGVPADARLMFGLAGWLPFGALLLAASPSVRGPAAANDAAGPGVDGLDRFMDRHGSRVLRLALWTVVIATPVAALVHGPTALWSGMGSLVLILMAVAMLGLTRTSGRGSPEEESASRTPWASTLRRALQIMVITVFALAFAAVWDIDLFGRANLHLGESAARGVMTVAVTAVLAYLTWEVIRTALAQSALRPPRAGIAQSDTSAEAAATRLQTFAPVLRNFLFVVVITVAMLVCLAALGINITPLLAGAGVIGIALGFGAQTLVRDVISGVLFLAEDAFRIGEYISIGNTRGTVEGIAIRSLKLRHHRGPVHTVPFGEIKQLTNYSRDWIIMKLEFLLAFDTDLRKVKSLVKQIEKELERST